MPAGAQKRTRRLSSGYGLKVAAHQSPAARRRRGSAARPSPPPQVLIGPDRADEKAEHAAEHGDNPAGGKENARRPAAVPRAKERLSNQQLTGLYSECIKLAAANKINQKNTWSLSLIDHMEDMLSGEAAGAGGAGGAGGRKVNFQRASCTLDASVKIYAHRVDSVHTSTYKVLGGLSRSGGGGGDDDADGEGGAARRRRKAARSTATLETNPANLNMKNADLQFGVDPLFKKTSASFDEGGASGLLLNNLCVFSGCSIVFDSSVPLLGAAAAAAAAEDDGSDGRDEDEAAASAAADVDLGSLRDLLHSATGPELPRLCPDLEGMKRWAARLLSDADASLEDAYADATRADAAVRAGAAAGADDYDNDNDGGGGMMLLDGGDDDDYGGDYDGGDDGGYGQADLDDANLMEARMEAELQDAAEGGAAPDAVQQQGGAAAPAGQARGAAGGADAEAMPLVFADASSDFSYLDSRALDNWAGASHWKFRASKMAVRRQMARGGAAGAAAGAAGAAAGAEGGAKRARKRDFFLDFSDEAGRVPETAFAKPARSNSTLTEATLNKADPSKCLLPTDVHFRPRRLQSLFQRPNLVLRLRKGGAAAQAAAAPGGGDFVDHDSALVCVPASGAGEFASAGGGGGGGGMFGAAAAAAGGAMPAPLLLAAADGGPMDDDDDMDGGGFELFDDSPLDGGAGGAFDDADASPFGPAGAGAYGGAFGGAGADAMDMVERPATVQKLGIKYAKFAKKVDVKKLKASLWEGVEEAPARAAAAGGAGGGGKDDDEAAGVPTFQETIDHAAATAASQGNGDASVPYCFICLLHLCNEKELELMPAGGDAAFDGDGVQQNLGNFTIVPPAGVAAV